MTDDTLILRAILDGLNTQGRQWGETITIFDAGSLDGLEREVEDHKYLRYVGPKGWGGGRPNIAIGFIDRMSMNRDTERLLALLTDEGVPTFIVRSYAGWEKIPQ